MGTKENFYVRLGDYFTRVAEVFGGKASAAAIFPNSSDIGYRRENTYASFLRQHAPSKCNVFLGGFLFHQDGTESKQIDVIVTTDTAPRFDFKVDGDGKSFAPVEGTIAVASIKSTLNKKELYDACENLASIPPTSTLEGRASPIVEIRDYEDWPYKVIYANNGVSATKLLSHVVSFYKENPSIPESRRPNLIHRSTKGAVAKKQDGTLEKRPIGSYSALTKEPDLHGILWVLHNIQVRSFSSTHIHFKYNFVTPVLEGRT